MELSTNSSKRILIVDDESDILEFLSYNFRKAGFVVSVAETAAQALMKTETEIPALVIADILMPGMNGIEMCRKMKKNTFMADVPIVFLTAINDDYKMMYAMLTGDQFVSKPVRFDFLLGLVNEMLDPSRRVNTSGFTIN